MPAALKAQGAQAPMPLLRGMAEVPRAALHGCVCEIGLADGRCELGVECAIVSGASWTGVARYPLRRCCLGTAALGRSIVCSLVRCGGSLAWAEPWGGVAVHEEMARAADAPARMRMDRGQGHSFSVGLCKDGAANQCRLGGRGQESTHATPAQHAQRARTQREQEQSGRQEQLEEREQQGQWAQTQQEQQGQQMKPEQLPREQSRQERQQQQQQQQQERPQPQKQHKQQLQQQQQQQQTHRKRKQKQQKLEQKQYEKQNQKQKKSQTARPEQQRRRQQQQQQRAGGIGLPKHKRSRLRHTRSTSPDEGEGLDMSAQMMENALSPGALVAPCSRTGRQMRRWRALHACRERFESQSVPERATAARALAADAAAACAEWDAAAAVRALRLAAAWLREPVLGTAATPGSAEKFPTGVLASQMWVRRAISDALRVLDLSDPATLGSVACELEAIRSTMAAASARGVRLVECRGGVQWIDVEEAVNEALRCRGAGGAGEEPMERQRLGSGDCSSPQKSATTLDGCGEKAAEASQPQSRARGRVQRCPHSKLAYDCLVCHPCKHGRLWRHCKSCNPCPHGKLKSKCEQCHACPHGKLKAKCKQCNGCPHGRLQQNCAECHPCPHGRLRSACRACTGCPHGKLRRGGCASCCPCPHGKVKAACISCTGCPHGKLKKHCSQCTGCPHGKVKVLCSVCSACPHGKLRQLCAACCGCPHGKLPRSCVTCRGCPHGRLKRNCRQCCGCEHGKLRTKCSSCARS